MRDGHAADSVILPAVSADAHADPLLRLAAGMQAMSAVPIAPRRVLSVAVIGAGRMGAGIAAACLRRVRVLVVDPDGAALRSALLFIRRRLSRDVVDGVVSRAEGLRCLRGLTLVQAWPAGAAPDLVVESVPEDLEVKRSVLVSIEPSLSRPCIWASNTSALTIAGIASAARHPDRVIGMHFFDPADRTQLLELAVPAGARDAALTARAFAILLNKCVVQVADAPGFYTTRVLSAYFGEALDLMAEGVAPEAIDRAAERFGFAAGPFALLDRIGIDVCARVAAYLATKSRRAVTERSPLNALAAAGLLGVKSGAGFYTYTDRRSLAPHGEANDGVRSLLGIRMNVAMHPRAIVARLVGRVVDEAARAVHQGVVRNELDADVAAVLGCGFPARTGGPLHYAAAHNLRVERAPRTVLHRISAARAVSATVPREVRT